MRLRAGFFQTFIIFFLGLPGALSWAEVNLKESYSRQISWAAANLDRPEVVAAFKKSPAATLDQGKRLLRVIDMREKLRQCLVSEDVSAEVKTALLDALKVQGLHGGDLPADPCEALKAKSGSVILFGKKLEAYQRQQAQQKILSIANSQLSQTKAYWRQVAGRDSLDLAVELTDRERDLKGSAPHGGAELLLYTQTLSKRKDKSYIGQKDVQKALQEVNGELDKHAAYLKEMMGENSDEALQNLVVSNPGAVAEFLMQNPDSVSMICQTLQKYDQQAFRKATIDKAVFWGGLVVGGVLLATGIGAGIGAMVVTSATAAGTLTTVAAGAAIAGTVSAGGEALYASSKAHDNFVEAQTFRSAGFAEANVSAFGKADRATDKAYGELAEAGFSAATILPFGTGLKMMKNAAMASKLGSFAKVAKEGASVEQASIKSLASSLKEISSDKDVLKALEKSQSQVSSDEMGMFLGYLSDLPAAERKQALELIKQRPEKVSQAIRESATSGVCR